MSSSHLCHEHGTDDVHPAALPQLVAGTTLYLLVRRLLREARDDADFGAEFGDGRPDRRLGRAVRAVANAGFAD